jgi:hypothetical protein
MQAQMDSGNWRREVCGRKRVGDEFLRLVKAAWFLFLFSEQDRDYTSGVVTTVVFGLSPVVGVVCH